MARFNPYKLFLNKVAKKVFLNLKEGRFSTQVLYIFTESNLYYVYDIVHKMITEDPDISGIYYIRAVTNNWSTNILIEELAEIRTIEF